MPLSPQSSALSPPPSRFRQILTPLLLILGIQGWLLITHGDWGRNSHVLLAAIATLVGCLPPIHRPLWRILRRLRRPRPMARSLIALSVSIAASAALAHSALSTHRELFPVMQDEFQFLLQARMLSEGHLWMPAHPLLDAFDTFYVLIQPKYAAQSFPGTAFFYVPAIWLHIQPWKWTILLAGISVGLIYLVVTELIDGLAGLLAAILFGLLSLLHFVSTMVLAQTPAVILGMLGILLYLCWRPKRRPTMAVLLGLVFGMAAITRPADALVFALPVAISFAFDLKQSFPLSLYSGGGLGWGFFHLAPKGVRALALMLLGALPWLGLQLVFDHGVTGHWLTTPFSYYNQRDQPALGYYLNHPPQIGEPVSHISQKRDYYRQITAHFIAAQEPANLWRTFWSSRLPVTLSEDLPQPLLAILIPLGWFACCRRGARRWIGKPWMLAATWPLFLLIYTPYPVFTTHYPIIAAPGAIAAVLLAPRAIAMAWPAARRGAWTALTIFVVGLLFTRSIEGVPPMLYAQAYPDAVLQCANDRVNELVKQKVPAVVLFRREEEISLDVEPVYNLDTSWPDDAPVIRAHDRGAQNSRLFQYYAQHGPDRAFYLFDESKPDAPLAFLGMGSDLAKRSDGH